MGLLVVGAKEGTDDGDLLGMKVGCEEVGLTEGVTVGEDGIMVGYKVVGRTEGVEVTVGATYTGCCVGLLGRVVGTRVGTPDGLKVGALEQAKGLEI